MGDRGIVGNEKFRDKMEYPIDSMDDLIDNYEELIEKVNEAGRINAQPHSFTERNALFPFKKGWNALFYKFY